MSPIFENNDAPDPNSDKYHGYSIQNYLGIDPRFDIKQDPIDLVAAAHKLDLRVILDVVLNHSSDNWSYPNNERYFYSNNQQFPFGSWRSETDAVCDLDLIVSVPHFNFSIERASFSKNRRFS